MNRCYLPIVLFVLSLSAPCYSQDNSKLVLSGQVRKLWDKGNHNAFTDLTRYKGKFYCVFREGSGHASGTGKIRVLVSENGKDWKSAALLSKKKTDLRDSHLSITPDGKLMINGGAAYPYTRNPVTEHYSFVSFSKDGSNWTPPRKVLGNWQWLWQVTWHKGNAYGVAYQWDPKSKSRKYSGALYKSKNGLDWQKLTDLGIPNTTEATIRFQGDTMLILQRRDGNPRTAQLGVVQAPYKKITWHDLGFYYGGPNLIRDPKGNWWTAGRIIKGGAKTVLCRLDLEKIKLQPMLTLPSGGDTSYPGLVWHDDRLWVSYYSSHQGRTSVYLAEVDVK